MFIMFYTLNQDQHVSAKLGHNCTTHGCIYKFSSGYSTGHGC